MCEMMPVDPKKVSATNEDGVITHTPPIAAHVKLKQIPVRLKEPPSVRWGSTTAH
jgi:hypothetical protein